MAQDEKTLMDEDMFRPPVNRAMRALDRSYFHKSIPLAAATVLESKNIAKFRTHLHNEILELHRVPSVTTDPAEKHLKALLLKPEVRPDSTVFPTAK